MQNRLVSRKVRKSISLEDLGSIVKQMIHGALDDTDQMAKLHRAIYEELYLEKSEEFEGGNVDKNISTSSSQKTIKAESIKNIPEFEQLEENVHENSRTICIEPKITDTYSYQEDYENIEDTNSEAAFQIMNNKQNSGIQKSQVKIRISLEDHTRRNDRAFDDWKREKTRSMRRMFKEERKKRREEIEARQAEIERKRLALEAQLRLKNITKPQRKLEGTQRQTIKEAYLRMQELQSERTAANEKAFNAWKRKKDNQSRRRFCQPRRKPMEKENAKYCNDEEFDSWLDQLDSVLHQKYLRERRYLVRSFYCQPAYYGTADMTRLI